MRQEQSARLGKRGVKPRRTIPLRLDGHPDAPGSDEWEAWARRSRRPLAVDLFCGAGGLSHGLTAAGYRVALSVDSDSWSLESHAHNLPGRTLQLDLGDERSRDFVVVLCERLDVDLIAGGPPCQPFSRAGRSKIRSLIDQGVRDAVDVRKELWRAFLDVVERVRPRAVLLENVPDMALGDEMLVLRTMIDRLERAGYEADASIVDASRHGVPQHRQRLILIGLRDGGPLRWPESSGSATVRDAIWDLPVLRVAPDSPIGAESMTYGDREASDFARAARKDCVGAEAWVVHDHGTRAVRPDDFEAFKLMTAGTLYSDLPGDLKRYRDDIFNDKYHRLSWTEPSRSITAHIAKDGYWYIHPEQHRTLTVREAARLQTFPDTFRFAGTRSHQFRQIGNAVPPVLGESIGSSILDSLRARDSLHPRVSTQRADFRVALANWATLDRADAPWAYPGNLWPVTVGLICRPGGKKARLTADRVLRLVPTLTGANEWAFDLLAASDGSKRYAALLDRIRAAAFLLSDDPDGWDSENWRDATRLGPAARRWYALMTGESDALVASAPVLRVAERMTGAACGQLKTNSARRMELAKLVGVREDAATLNVAMHRIGTDFCAPKSPDCHRCPLKRICRGAAS